MIKYVGMYFGLFLGQLVVFWLIYAYEIISMHKKKMPQRTIDKAIGALYYLKVRFYSEREEAYFNDRDLDDFSVESLFEEADLFSFIMDIIFWPQAFLSNVYAMRRWIPICHKLKKDVGS